jgi:biopolymer transport protein TolR
VTTSPTQLHPGSIALSPEPNVTPMIDVLLVLLIIFMAAIPAQRKALTGQLPPEETGQPGQVAAIVLDVGPGGRYAVNRQAVPPTHLATTLETIYRGRPDKTLIVKGASTARYQEVITAMDIARGAGVRVVGVDTRRD